MSMGHEFQACGVENASALAQAFPFPHLFWLTALFSTLGSTSTGQVWRLGTLRTGASWAKGSGFGI